MDMQEKLNLYLSNAAKAWVDTRKTKLRQAVNVMVELGVGFDCDAAAKAEDELEQLQNSIITLKIENRF